jgi:hypothetical protein
VNRVIYRNQDAQEFGILAAVPVAAFEIRRDYPTEVIDVIHPGTWKQFQKVCSSEGAFGRRENVGNTVLTGILPAVSRGDFRRQADTDAADFINGIDIVIGTGIIDKGNGIGNRVLQLLDIDFQGGQRPDDQGRQH